MMTPRALIFDLDHTLADTTAVWQRAQEQLAAYFGQTWNDELERLERGVNAYDLAAAAVGAPPGASLVCEDSPAGIHAAQ